MFPSGKRGKHLGDHAPKLFRLEAFNRCGPVKAVRVDQQCDPLFATTFERRRLLGSVRYRHRRKQVQAFCRSRPRTCAKRPVASPASIAGSAAFISPIGACWTRSGSGSHAPRLKRLATETASGAKARSKGPRTRLSSWFCEAYARPRSNSAGSMSGMRIRRAPGARVVNGMFISAMHLVAPRQ